MLRAERTFEALVERGLDRAGLSPRQRQVARGKVLGQTCGEIAWELRLAESTVEGVATAVFARAGVSSTVQLLRWLVELGLREGSDDAAAGA